MNDIVGVVAGMALGLTGLIPFLHANTVVEVFSNYFSEVGIEWIAALLVFSRLPFEFLAAVKLLTSREENSFSLHPFQQLSQRGEGEKALKLAITHCGTGILCAIILFPLVSTAAPLIYLAVKPFAAIAIGIVFVIFLLGNENRKDAFAIALLAGLLGIIALEKNIASNSLFLLLSGLFAVPVLVEDINAGRNKQNKQSTVTDSKQTQGGSAFYPQLAIYGGVIALASVFFPGVSVTVLTALALTVFRETEIEKFISLNAAIIGGRAVSDLAALEFIGKARSGAAAALMENLPAYKFETAMLHVVAGASAFLFASFAAMAIFKRINFNWFENKIIRFAILIALFSYAFAADGFAGLAVIAAASLVGLTALNFQCSRAVLSSVVIAPVVFKALF